MKFNSTSSIRLLLVIASGMFLTMAPLPGQETEIPDPFSNSPVIETREVESEDPTFTTTETATVDDNAEADQAEVDETEAPDPTTLEKVDAIFAKIVDGMATVLFYEIFKGEQEYFEFQSDDPTEDVLNGTWVWSDEDELFHKLEKMRDALSLKYTMSREEAAEYATAGDLKPLPTEDNTTTHIGTRTTKGAPLVVIWLACGSLFFTLYMGFYNFWGFGHAVEIVGGKYDNPNETGEVTHFQALSSALSATVGLGNIAGVTLAMTMGGPGAFFWMICCGFFGMSSKFVECTLGQKYRHVKPDGTVLGGPMRYLDKGLSELGLRPLGLLLSFTFTIMCILASFGGGNMFQANQSGTVMLEQLQQDDKRQLVSLNEELATAKAANDLTEIERLQTDITVLESDITSFDSIFRIAYGLILAALVALVIVGGIKRIGAAAEKIVPTMCAIYVAVCLYIICAHITQIPELVIRIFTEAFSPRALGGGFIGVLVVGVQRAAFSNEAGVGSAAIAHSAARTEEPIREGSVALLGPFIDTIIICSMTALVILITGAWDNQEWILGEGLAGAALTSRAFGSEVSFFPWVLSVAVILFAYSTIISWSYYGERSWEQLFGPRSTFIYKFLTIVFVFLGAIFNLGSVLDFSDMMILSMAFPNILGVVILAPKVKRDLADYWRRYKAGEFKTYK
ncbi:Amino-acid carrier protein AlsT [Polystyrenella longa]|uniref:Amino-acid carrier protein AlsT n=1 Tax=Polystyrenella longa TaxID=2528007 RepID=A0A518CL65_9PLAN|nr:alanine/glycine:cation symporter family protein [Polystyrenella longa]QDU79972.1 Amino-acid carrier protein AlsT [Polystyrenella longa]